MTDLRVFVEAWKSAADAVVELAEGLTVEQLQLPTDCPEWTVHDVLAHLAHLETVLLSAPEPAGDAAVVPSDYTAAGVAERRSVPTPDVVTEFQHAVAARYSALAELPEDPSQIAPVTPSGVPWSWETLLRNRVVDVWTHEQDVRRAVDLPGNLGSAGAAVTAHTFAAGMPFVLGKKVKAPAGTAVRWVVDGGVPFTVGAVVGDDGRARRDDDAEPDATLTMTTEAFTVLAAGRRGPDDVEVAVEGDADLARRVLDAMTLTF